MKVGILGTGDVGKALARGFLADGHKVMIGTRDPKSDKATALVAAVGPNLQIGTFADAAKFADLAVLATAWSGTGNAIKLAGPDNLAGKILIDATNPLDFTRKPLGLSVGYSDSAGEQVQRWVPKAKVVKAFNTVGNALMVYPKVPGGPPDMFIAGNDVSAKGKVTEICRAWCWNVIDLGPIVGARYLEPLAIIWCLYGFATNTWTHAFKLLKA